MKELPPSRPEKNSTLHPINMDNPLIQQIRLDSFLSFAPNSEPIELRPLNVLIGPNGSGKSNLIDAIALLSSLSDCRSFGWLLDYTSSCMHRRTGAWVSPRCADACRRAPHRSERENAGHGDDAIGRPAIAAGGLRRVCAGVRVCRRNVASPTEQRCHTQMAR